MSGFFITATDTDAGKTFVATQLLHYWNHRGYRTLGFKPVASGCQLTDNGLQNDDAVKLGTASSVSVPYSSINPYPFEPAIGPHIAAQMVDVSINIQSIAKSILAHQEQVDRLLVEGVGGWLVPLNERETVADLALLLNLPVILVVNLRLGCINQALLTARAIEQTGLSIAGWIANNTNSAAETTMTHQQENIQSIEERINTPLLGVLPYYSGKDLNNVQLFEDYIDMKKIQL